MIKVKFPQNFVSGVYYLPETEKHSIFQVEASSEEINEIKTTLKQAQDYYKQGTYQKAISSYKAVQGMIFRILYPEFAVGPILADDQKLFPYSPKYERVLADASLKFIERMQPEIDEVPIPVDVWEDDINPGGGYLEEVGFHQDPSIQGQIEHQVALGIKQLQEGQIRQSIETFEKANRKLVRVSRRLPLEGQQAFGVLQLNLSSAYLLNNQIDEAQKMANSAKNYLNNAKDELGLAQALHNEAVALYKQRNRRAKETFEQAVELYESVQRNWHGSSEFAQGASINLEGINKPSIQLNNLDFISKRNPSMVSLRWPGKGAGWQQISLNPIKKERQEKDWFFGVERGKKVTKIKWEKGYQPKPETILEKIYKARVDAKTIPELAWRPSSDSAFVIYLLHIYAYVAPLGLGDCYHQLGNYQRAEVYYLKAADYTYINKKLEVPALWAKMAANYVAWGDHLYKNEKIDECQQIYSRLIEKDAEIPTNSPLFKHSSFQNSQALASAKEIIIAIGDEKDIPDEADPGIAWPILTAWSRWNHLLAGLDFYGLQFTPIFTFEYLQQVAQAFAQQSIQAEREFITFKDKAEMESATRRELEAAITLAEAEADVQYQQYLAAQEDRQAAENAVSLAELRAQNTIDEKNKYQSAGYHQYQYQSIATAHSAGADWHGDEIRELANDMENGSWSGKSGKLAAAATLLSGQYSYEYQMERLQNDSEEMNAMIPIARDQAQAARYRQQAAQAAWYAAKKRQELTQDALAAFDNEYFTPELWTQMANVMKWIAQGYQDWAIRVAKLMERAYNFENDTQLKIIKSNYHLAITNGLLGSDLLLKDIESFTYHYISHQKTKETRVKDVISLANEYPFLFYQFQETGKMVFETLLQDFDRRHPGLYSQKIKGIELEIVGLLPQDGVQGILRAGGLSRYRTINGGFKSRIHNVDTMALSEFTVRNDAFIYRMNPNIHGLFEGHGVATSWNLNLPRRSNNFDYRLIYDVRLVLYYSAQYSPALEQMVLNRPALPGEMVHVRDFLLRYDFPENWYTFLDTGEMTFTINEKHLPRNECAFKTDKLALSILTAEGVSPANVKVVLTMPGRSPVTVVTDANGTIAASENHEAPNAISRAMGGDLQGEWHLKIEPVGRSPLFNSDGSLREEIIEQIVLITQYTFEWPDRGC